MRKMASNISIYLRCAPIQRAVTVMLISMLLALVSLFLWLPSYLENKNYTKENVRLQYEVDSMRAKMSLAENLYRNRAAMVEIDAKLTQKINQATLIKELSRVASASGVVLADQTFREVATYEGFDVYGQSLVVKGSYRKIRYFLAQLSSSIPGLNVVGKISINKEPDNVISARIDLETYAAANL